MRTHIIKLYNLSDRDMRYIPNHLSYWTRNCDVKLRVLKTVIYIHLTDEQTYSGIFNMCYYYWQTHKMSVNKRDMKWLKRYMTRL